jgi:hypothetical protein
MLRSSTKCLILAPALAFGLAVSAQTTSGTPGGAGVVSFKTPVKSSDLRIAERAASLLDSAAKWNHGYVGDCSTDKSNTLTLYCSLDRAAREVSGELDERSAVRQESRAVIAFLTANEYGMDAFNGDPDVTFGDIQTFFRVLHIRLTKRLEEQNPSSRAQAKGGESESRLPVTVADLRIVRQAKQILDSPSKWNRADNRVCPAGAKTFSLYCALEQATKEVSGNFEHRGAAMQESRFVVEDIAPNAGYYGHRLMDFNNDPGTTFWDVQKFFYVLEERLTSGQERRSQ